MCHYFLALYFQTSADSFQTLEGGFDCVGILTPVNTNIQEKLPGLENMFGRTFKRGAECPAKDITGSCGGKREHPCIP